VCVLGCHVSSDCANGTTCSTTASANGTCE
jgi:hypothetical protein